MTSTPLPNLSEQPQIVPRATHDVTICTARRVTSATGVFPSIMVLS
jgi:hypothetical protein